MFLQKGLTTYFLTTKDDKWLSDIEKYISKFVDLLHALRVKAKKKSHLNLIYLIEKNIMNIAF